MKNIHKVGQVECRIQNAHKAVWTLHLESVFVYINLYDTAGGLVYYRRRTMNSLVGKFRVREELH
jgi:hypothetical protein